MLTKQDNTKTEHRDVKNILIRLLGYMFRYWYLLLPACLMTLLSNQLALLGPKYSGEAIDAIVLPGGVDFGAVKENIIKMLFCYLLSAVTAYVLAVLMLHISQNIACTMRKQLFEKLTSLPVSYFDTHPTGDIISRISYDIDTINSSMSNDFVQIMTSMYTVIGSLIFMWNISKPMIAVLVITVPIAVIFTRFRSKRVRPLFHKRSKKLGELNGYAEEMLSGQRTVHAYHRKRSEDVLVIETRTLWMPITMQITMAQLWGPV